MSNISDVFKKLVNLCRHDTCDYFYIRYSVDFIYFSGKRFSSLKRNISYFIGHFCSSNLEPLESKHPFSAHLCTKNNLFEKVPNVSLKFENSSVCKHNQQIIICVVFLRSKKRSSAGRKTLAHSNIFLVKLRGVISSKKTAGGGEKTDLTYLVRMYDNHIKTKK